MGRAGERLRRGGERWGELGRAGAAASRRRSETAISVTCRPALSTLTPTLKVRPSDPRKTAALTSQNSPDASFACCRKSAKGVRPAAGTSSAPASHPSAAHSARSLALLELRISESTAAIDFWCRLAASLSTTESAELVEGVAGPDVAGVTWPGVAGPARVVLLLLSLPLSLKEDRKRPIRFVSVHLQSGVACARSFSVWS